MSIIGSVSKHKKICCSVVYTINDFCGFYYCGVEWNKYIVKKHKKVMKTFSCNHNSDYSSNYSHFLTCPFANCERSHDQLNLNHSKHSFKILDMNEIYFSNTFLKKPLINLCSFSQCDGMNCNYNVTDKVIRNKLSDLNSFLFNTHTMQNGKATSNTHAESCNFSQQYKNSKVCENSNIHKIQHKSYRIGGDMLNKTHRKIQTDFVRYFSCNKQLRSLDDENENSRKNYDKTWTKQINENCKITYHVKSKDNVGKAQYTVECKENGNNMKFSSDNLSTGQKLIGAVMTLFFVIVAAYCTLFLMSLAASVIIIAAIAAFFISCYQIMKKKWKSGGR